jgi:uncharacterized membrane protein YkvA (DUF1232 family)
VGSWVENVGKVFDWVPAERLAIPIDVIPDFIPILGSADDAIVVVLILRSVCRRVSMEELREAWSGTDDGFAALYQLVNQLRSPVRDQWLPDR